MKALTKLQLHLFHTLINDPLKAFKLRTKYTKVFDYMFKHVFGESFGIEIEINPKLYKDENKGWHLFHNINRHVNTIDKIETLAFPKIKPLYSTKRYKARRYKDGKLDEYTIPIRAKSLHIVYKYLNQIQRHLIGPLGSSFDTSSSMHLHTTPISISNSMYNKGIDVHCQKLADSIPIDCSRKQFNSLKEGCSSINRSLVIDSYEGVVHRNNCDVCLNCRHHMLNYFDLHNHIFNMTAIQKEYHVNKLFKNDKLLFTESSRYYILIHKGLPTAEALYLSALRLIEPKVLIAVGGVFGVYDTNNLQELLDYIIFKFIPYSKTYEVPDEYQGSIVENSIYKSFELRFFPGSLDFRTILLRAMFAHAMVVLAAHHDATLLNLFIDTLVEPSL